MAINKKLGDVLTMLPFLLVFVGVFALVALSLFSRDAVIEGQWEIIKDQRTEMDRLRSETLWIYNEAFEDGMDNAVTNIMKRLEKRGLFGEQL
jgi:hypothetical protein